MVTILDKVSKFLKIERKRRFTDSQLKELVNETRLDERKWLESGGELLGSPNNRDDVFYESLELTQIGAKEIKVAKALMHKGLSKLSDEQKDKISSVMAATGWQPNGIETAAVRTGSLDELSLIQDACFKKYILDPLAKSIVKNYQYFVIGKGIKVSSIVPEVDLWIKNFDKLNRMISRRKQMVKSTFIEGEYFLLFYIKDNKVILRKTVPSRIMDIQIAEEDVEQLIAFEVASLKDSTGSYLVKSIEADQNEELFGTTVNTSKISEVSPNKYIQMMKFGEEEYVRGLPPMYPILRYLKYYEDWLMDRMRLNHERAKVIWIRSRTGSASTGDSFLRAPKGGLVLDETPLVKYRIESAKLDSFDAKEDGLAILYTIGSGVNIPLHILTQRTSESVYASIRKGETPFSQMIEDSQEYWSEQWDIMYRFAMEKSGEFEGKSFEIPVFDTQVQTEAMQKINKMVIEDKPIEEIIEEIKPDLDKSKIKTRKVGIKEVPIDQTFPQVVQEDPLVLAKVLFLHRKMGIVSYQTASERAGYDWHKELVKIQVGKKLGLEDDIKDKDGQVDLDDSSTSAEPNA